MHFHSLALAATLFCSLTSAVPKPQATRIPIIDDDHSLDVKLTEGSENGIIEASLTNKLDEPLYIFKQEPLLSKNPMKHLSVFKDGKEIPFRGVIHARWNHDNMTIMDFLPIMPNKNITRTIDLAKLWDFEEDGEYTVKAQGVMRAGDLGPDDVAFQKLMIRYDSNKLKININAKKAQKVRRAVQKLWKRARIENCGGQQQQQVQDMMQKAAQLAQQAAQDARDPSNPYMQKFFEADQNAAQEISRKFDMIAKECAGGQGAVYHCGESRNGAAMGWSCQPGLLGYTQDDGNAGQVFTCPAWYQLPVTPVDCNSNDQASELIHELSHSSIVLQSQNWNKDHGYGIPQILQLSPQQKQTNADNYNFFVIQSTLKCPTDGSNGGANNGGNWNNGGGNNWNQGGNNWNQGGNNWNRGNNWNQGGNNWNRGNNWNQGGNNWNQGGNNWNQGGNNWNQGGNNWSQGGNDWNQSGNNWGGDGGWWWKRLVRRATETAGKVFADFRSS